MQLLLEFHPCIRIFCRLSQIKNKSYLIMFPYGDKMLLMHKVGIRNNIQCSISPNGGVNENLE